MRNDERVLGFLRSTAPSDPMEITRANVTAAASRSMSVQRSAQSSPDVHRHRGDDEKHRQVGIVAFGGVERGHHLRTAAGTISPVDLAGRGLGGGVEHEPLPGGFSAPERVYDYGARTAPLGSNHGASPLQAPRRLRHRRQPGNRALAGSTDRQRLQPAVDAGEETGVQPVRPRAAQPVLGVPLPPTAVANRPAGLPSRSTPTSAGSRRSRPT